MSTSDELRQYPRTVLEKGYGIVGKIVMQDTRIPVGAKALYAYICTFGTVAYPGREKICHDLQINKDTYMKHMRILRTYGYISVQQVREEGKYKHNLYIVNATPKPEIGQEQEINEEIPAKVPCPKKTATTFLPHPKFSDTALSGTVESDAESSDTKKPSYNNTTTNNTILNSTIHKTTTEDEIFVVAHSFGIKESVIAHFIREYGRDAVEAEMNLLKKSMKSNKITNAGGWLRRALEEGYVDGEAAFLKEQEAKRLENRKRIEAIEKQIEEQMRLERAEHVPIEHNEFYKMYLRHKEKSGSDKNRAVGTQNS